MLEKLLRVNRLLELYSGLLTERHARITEYYYVDNLSLGEIAEIEGISRQAVHDGIERSVEVMEQADSAIDLVAKTDRLAGIAECLSKVAYDDVPDAKDVREKIKQLAERLSEEIQSGGKR